MNRDEMVGALEGDPFDVLVIGGGASGLGVAVDAQTRGYRTLLLEKYDFAKGTSSRSTKLVHGGVRYLQQGNVSLVFEALRERGLLCRNAPHLVSDLGFVVPRYKWWEGPFYGVGLKVYDRLAGRLNIAPSRVLDRKETIAHIPNVQTEDLLGGVIYHDAQFDDARMAFTLARTAADHGATVLNYVSVVGLMKEADSVIGVRAVDEESGREIEIRAKVVVNATGIFADQVRRMDVPESEVTLAPSQGVHLVLDRAFQPSDTALMVPHTDDGRVLFVIPWHGRVLVGTTDTPVDGPEIEPRPLPEEVDFILRNAGRYLERDPGEADVLSYFAGLRPLFQGGGERGGTKSISREHSVIVSDSGLVTLVGGKWTTYRKMGEDTVDDAALVAELPESKCITEDLRLHGWMSRDDPDRPHDGHMAMYGSDAKDVYDFLATDPALAEPIHANLPYARGQVVWAARYEMARNIDDVLARRTRSLLLDAKAAIEAAPDVGRLLAGELGRDDVWVKSQVEEFQEMARGYLP
ncbi:MAG: glycerol-3-phosphate dehydrogenase/oxidase [Candidatus Binatia bacterium]|nr:glycerol-3-phosphate dehydrogenase/oxidase [Candidatus Binatia bacterium]